MDEFIFHSSGPEKTQLFGKKLGENLQAGDVVALIGEIGAGKTCLTQGIAKGLGIPEGFRITSPTFTLINEYHGPLALYHMDMYRLATIKELEDTGYEACFHDKAVIVIEWAEKIREALPGEIFIVSLTYISDNERQIRVAGNRERLSEIINEVKAGGL